MLLHIMDHNQGLCNDTRLVVLEMDGEVTEESWSRALEQLGLDKWRNNLVAITVDKEGKFANARRYQARSAESADLGRAILQDVGD